ncbi:MAG: hypothetical protein WC498_01820 [Candidatus Saccharimonadales bacterium]
MSAAIESGEPFGPPQELIDALRANEALTLMVWKNEITPGTEKYLDACRHIESILGRYDLPEIRWAEEVFTEIPPFPGEFGK